MRAAIAKEKGDRERWDLKYAAGGLIDIEFIAQYLQLVHAAALPDILDTSTARVLDKAWQLGVLAVEDAEVLRPAVQLYHDLTQILRLCLPGPFDPKAAGPGLLRLLARAADVPDFATLEAHADRDARPRCAQFRAHSGQGAVGRVRQLLVGSRRSCCGWFFAKPTIFGKRALAQCLDSFRVGIHSHLARVFPEIFTTATAVISRPKISFHLSTACRIQQSSRLRTVGLH